MTALEVLDKISEFVRQQQDIVNKRIESNAKSTHNIAIGSGSVLSQLDALIKDIRLEEIRQIEEIIDGD